MGLKLVFGFGPGSGLYFWVRACTCRPVYNSDSATHRKRVLIRQIIVSNLYTVVGGQQFRKEWRKLKTRIMLERYYSFFHYCLLSYRYIMFQKRILSKPKWRAQAVVRGARPPWPTRSDGTDQKSSRRAMNTNFWSLVLPEKKPFGLTRKQIEPESTVRSRRSTHSTTNGRSTLYEQFFYVLRTTHVRQRCLHCTKKRLRA